MFPTKKAHHAFCLVPANMLPESIMNVRLLQLTPLPLPEDILTDEVIEMMDGPEEQPAQPANRAPRRRARAKSSASVAKPSAKKRRRSNARSAGLDSDERVADDSPQREADDSPQRDAVSDAEPVDGASASDGGAESGDSSSSTMSSTSSS